MFFGVLIVPIVATVLSGGVDVTMATIDPNTWNLFPSGDQTITTVVINSSIFGFVSYAWGHRLDQQC